MKLAGLSLDVDSVASHLQGYGFERPADDGAAYRLAVPRAMQLFEALGVRCTFFLIAEEAARYPHIVAELVARGHEVASHSLTHRLPFSTLSPAVLSAELRTSKRVLEALTGRPVAGFRAPSWDVSAAILCEVAEAGYEYDASSYPAPYLQLLQLAVRRRSHVNGGPPKSVLSSDGFGPAVPHVRRLAGRSLAELPVSSAPGLRLPYYHTLAFLLPPAAFDALGSAVRLRRSAVLYQFHAVDFLDLQADGLDLRIARHPGMNEPLERKTALAARVVGALARTRRVVPLVEVARALMTEPPALPHGNGGGR